MTGTQVSTIVRGPQPVMAMTAGNIDFDMVKKYASAMRGGERMPGELMLFKQGEFLIGKDAIDLGTRAVANVPNLMFAWRKWADGIPHTPHVCYPLIGQGLPTRDELGDLDKSLWENQKDDKGRDQKDDNGNFIKVDPWRMVAILMMRAEDGEDLFRFETDSFGGKGAIADLCTAYGDKGKRYPSKLPVVELTTEKKTRKGSTAKYYVPVLSIVDWAEATDVDYPEGGVSMVVKSDENADEGEVKSKSRAAPKAAPKTIEHDPEETPAPRKTLGGAKKPAAAPAEDDDEDDVKAAPRRTLGLRRSN